MGRLNHSCNSSEPNFWTNFIEVDQLKSTQNPRNFFLGQRVRRSGDHRNTIVIALLFAKRETDLRS
jgi:hypothetical protein